MKKIVLGVFSVAYFFGNAQVQGQYQLDNSAGISWTKVSLANEREEEAVSGTKYIVSSYLPAKISGFEREMFGLRYNAVQDEMEFEQNGETYYLPKFEDMKVVFPNQSNKTYAFLKYNEKGNDMEGFLVVLNGNSYIKLYKKEYIKYIPAKQAVSSYDTYQTAQYKRANDAYFIENKGEIVLFPKNKKELIKMFPDKNSQISDYLKNNKISFSKESDLIELSKFLNTL